MFSSDVVTTNTHQLRSKRSRRQGSEESIKLPQAKKRRSALRKDTFAPPVDTSVVDPAPSGDSPASVVNGHAPEEKAPANGSAIRSTELTLRGSKKTEKRPDRSDGSFILSSNDYYSVAQLPALPEQIRSHSSTPFSSLISPEHGYALALTHSHALIWPYNSPSAAPSSKDTVSFSLPFSIPTNEALPIGAFTAKSTTKEPGLVIVTPTKGKIVYWETISSASSLVSNPQASGVQGSVPGMLGGEVITGISNAEPAGFILTFSHGRVAHLTLKDQLGRPAIGVQFLRKVPLGSQGSLFGSIRNVFGGSGRKSVAAAHAGRASRGQRDVIVVTEDADVEVWDTRLSVGNSLKYQLNMKEDILDSLRRRLPADKASSFQFRVLEFSFSPKPSNSQELSKPNGETPEELMFLVSLTHSDRANYFIVESQVAAEATNIKHVHPITCYRKTSCQESAFQSKLILPYPGLTAIVVFETAIVLYSLAKLEESPSSQLIWEGGSIPEPFQDCVRFQEDTPFRVLSASGEDRADYHKHPSVVIAVQSFGIIRISATLEQAVAEEIEDIKVTSKSKIEQAVFFGNLKNNPLDLVSQGEQQFAPEEVEEAALEISEEILTSKSRYLPKASPSAEQNLRSRAKAHDDLALHLSKYYNPLPRHTRFQLLWNAEKLAVQRAMWKTEEEHRKRRPADEETILQHILFHMHPDTKTELDQSRGENDRVRHWFMFDANRVQDIIPWFHHIHSELYKDEVTEPKAVAENIFESIEHFQALFETAFHFRETNASLYGLGDETLSEGMSVAGYALLEVPWTCIFDSHVSEFTNMTSDSARKWWVIDTKSLESPNPATVRKIGTSLPRQTEILHRVLMEKVAWCKAQQDEATRLEGKELELDLVHHSRSQLLSMAGLGFSNEAISLTEKFADMDLLVELNIDAIAQLFEQSSSQTNPKEADRLQREAEKVNDRMESYFDRFKDNWASAYYEKLIQDGQLGSLVNDEKNQGYLTRFLRKNPAYGKISWVNDILGAKSFKHAAATLASIAQEQEANLWSKKVELSLSKLATLAEVEVTAKATGTDPKPTSQQAAHISKMTSFVSLLDLQERLHLHVTSLIGRNILDFPSRHELAFEILGKPSPAVKGKPAFKGLLYDGLGALLRQDSMSVDQLVDVLTLMSSVGDDSTHEDKITDETVHAGLIGDELYFALIAIELALPWPSDEMEGDTLETRTKRDALQKLVWRRIMLRDDWEALNRTDNKIDAEVLDSMRETVFFTTAYSVYEQYLFEMDQPHPPLTIPSPSSIQESNLFPSVLSSRFKPQEVELVRKDLEAESKQLQQAIDKARLNEWFPDLIQEIKDAVVGRQEAKGDAAVAQTEEVSFDETQEIEPAVQDAGDTEDSQQHQREHSDVDMRDETVATRSSKRRSVRFAAKE